jgi:hypothetical protein
LGARIVTDAFLHLHHEVNIAIEIAACNILVAFHRRTTAMVGTVCQRD